MQAYAEQLANSLTGISELLLEVTNSTVTINQVRRIKESLESFSESFQSTSNNQRCLNTLFAHEGSILCLMCNGQMTKDMVIVENSLFRGQMYFPTTTLNIVVQNCQTMFQKMFKMVSLMVMGLFTFDDKDKINLALYSQNSKFLEWLIVLHKSMFACMAQQNCVHYVRQLISPYGTKLDWLLLGNEGTKDAGEFIARLFDKSYSKDLRILQKQQGSVDFDNLKDGIAENWSEFLEKVDTILNQEFVQEQGKENGEKVEYPHKDHEFVKRLLQVEDSAKITQEQDKEMLKQARIDENRQAKGLFDLQTVFSDGFPTKIDTIDLGFKQLLNLGFDITDLLVTKLEIAKWIFGFLGIIFFMGVVVN